MVKVLSPTIEGLLKRPNGRFSVYIRHDCIINSQGTAYLGTFDSVEEAATVRDKYLDDHKLPGRRNWIEYPEDIPGCRWIYVHPNKFTLVDEEDYESLVPYKWSIEYGNSDGLFYAYRSIVTPLGDNKYSSKRAAIHRVILNVLSSKLEVDHINNDGLDNRKINLRLCTRVQNHRNKRANKTGCTSKYKGVNKPTDKKKFRCTFEMEDVHMIFGYYESEHQAAHVYNIAAIELFGEWANPNIIEEPVTEETKIKAQQYILKFKEKLNNKENK